MKKIVLNISDLEYEKFRFEAIHEKKSIQDILKDRIFHKPFHEDVLESYDAWMNAQLTTILGENLS
jgi:hypothetical protein